MAEETSRFVSRIVVAAAVASLASIASAQVSSLNLDFNGSGGGFLNTGFDAAYNPDTTTFNLNFAGNGRLGILTAPGDIYGGYENDPDNAKNMFYTNFNVGARAVAEVKVTALNINQNFHGGGVWMGTDQDHYIRLGIINNSFEGGVVIEALRENEDRWPQDGTYPNRPGFDIEGRALNVNDLTTPTVGGAETGRDLTDGILRIVRDGNAVACYFSGDNGATFMRVGGENYSFNSMATDATTLRVDNRTAGNPNNPDTTSSTVEGGMKVGVYAFGGGANGAVLQFDSLKAITGVPTYTGPATGSYTDNANWSNNNGLGAPTNIESSGVLPSAASARTLDISSNITATNLRFENAAGDTLSGTGEVRFDWFYFPTHPDYYNVGPGTVAVTAGSHTISAPSVLAHLHRFDIAAGSSLSLTNMQASPFDSENPQNNADAGVRKLGAGTLRVNRLLTNQVDVQAGTLQVIAGGGANVSVVKSVAVATGAGSTAKLDLTDNAMVIDYTDSSSLAAVTALVASGYANGAQTGAGIITSTGGASRAIGIADASALTTVPAIFGTVDSTSVLLRTTYRGDSDLNGAVNFDDLLKLAQAYGLSSQRWTNGDSNYDGIVNFDDLLALAQNYGLGALTGTTLTDSQLSTLGESFAADWAAAVSLVPEPTSLAALSAASMLVGRRRRTI
jgi:hypothetical protein